MNLTSEVVPTIDTAEEIKVGEVLKVEASEGTVQSTPEAVDLTVKPTEQPPQQRIEIPPLTYKEARALKRSRYIDDIKFNPKFKKSYVLFNKKTGQMVEIRAASVIHACNIIGWKPSRVHLVSETEIKSKNEPETIAHAG